MSSTVQYTGWLQAYSTAGWILVYILQGVGYWSTVRWIWVHSGVDVGQQGVDTVLYMQWGGNWPTRVQVQKLVILFCEGVDTGLKDVDTGSRM